MFWLETFFHLLEYTGEQIPRKNETNIGEILKKA